MVPTSAGPSAYSMATTEGDHDREAHQENGKRTENRWTTKNTHQAKLQNDSSQRWPVICVSKDGGDTNAIDTYDKFRLRTQREN